MTDTVVATPDPEEPSPDRNPELAAEWLAEMGTKTDVELVSAYIAASRDRLPFIHPLHVVRILKLATLGLGAAGD